MPREDIGSFSDVLSRFLEILSGAGFEYRSDYTWGTGGDYNYWIIDSTGWYTYTGENPVELKLYMYAPSANPSTLYIKGCSNIIFYDDYDQYGNLIGRKVTVSGSFDITTLTGTGTCYYGYADRVAYMCTPSSTILFVRANGIDCMKIFINQRAYGDYYTFGGFIGGWGYSGSSIRPLTTKLAVPSPIGNDYFDDVYYCTASDWYVFYMPGKGYFFKVKGYPIALPATGDEGIYIGSAVEVPWEEATEIGLIIKYPSIKLIIQ